MIELISRLGFAQPMALALLLPWFVALGIWGRGQWKAVRWIHTHVDSRFRHRLTRHDSQSFGRYLLWLGSMGTFLVVAAAGPVITGQADITAESGHVLLLLDGSASMNASDVEVPAEQEGGSRFEQARWIARDLVRALPDVDFGIVTFSGGANLQMPLESDRELLEEALRVVEIDNFYASTGSSFTSALDAVLGFVGGDPGPQAENEEAAGDGSIDLQVVLLSDGEIPTLEDGTQPPNSDYGDALAAVAARGIPVHTVAIGSLEGETRLIYDFRDVVAQKPVDERAVLREFTTRRQVEHLKRMSSESDGKFAIAEDAGTAEAAATVIASAIENREARGGWLEKSGEGRDVSHVPLALFVLAFLVEGLRSGRDRDEDGGGAEAFRLDRLGVAGLILMSGLLFVHGCDRSGGPLERAHQENERGITLGGLGQSEAARRHFERSRSFGRRAQIPTHNLARSLAEDGRFAEAHQSFQEALELDPELADAHYNDGVTLYGWGEAERDPEGCFLERTLELWRHSRDRFASTLDFAEPDSGLALRADENYRSLNEQIEALEEAIANPPAECSSEPPPPSPGGAGAGEDENENDESNGGGSAGGGGGGDEGREDDPGEDSNRGGSSGNSAGGEGQEQGEGEADEDPEAGARGGGSGDDGEPDQPPPVEPPPEPPPQGEGQPPPGTSPPGTPPPGSGPAPAGGQLPDPAQLSEEERQQIGEALARIAEQRREGGKYHRRTRAEQFPRSSWQNPESIIWW